MPAFDAPPPLGRAKEHSVFAQNQTRLGCLSRQEGPRNCAALPRSTRRLGTPAGSARIDRKSTRLNSSHLVMSYAAFCLTKKKHTNKDFALQHHTSSTYNTWTIRG